VLGDGGVRGADGHSRQDMLKTYNHWKLCQEEKCVCERRLNLNDTYAGMEIIYRCNELPALLSVCLSASMSVCTSVTACSDISFVMCLHKHESVWSAHLEREILKCSSVLYLLFLHLHKCVS
jgi:hypothetical protein